jgi:hypothetical protein
VIPGRGVFPYLVVRYKQHLLILSKKHCLPTRVTCTVHCVPCRRFSTNGPSARNAGMTTTTSHCSPRHCDGGWSMEGHQQVFTSNAANKVKVLKPEFNRLIIVRASKRRIFNRVQVLFYIIFPSFVLPLSSVNFRTMHASLGP